MNKLMTLDEVKQVELEILEYVDKICKENNIQYSLADGTMLGAVRHKGFIPWDDDIDILLKREEYEKLLRILYSKTDEKYQVFSPKDEGYWYSYAKVTDTRTIIVEKNWSQYEGMGVYIDIFPIDYLGEDPINYIKTARYYDKCLKWCLTNIAYKDEKIYKRIIKRILRWKEVNYCRKKGEKYWKNKLEELRLSPKNGTMVNFCASDVCRGYDVSVLDKYTTITFENRQFQIIERYDEMLKFLYGDYMQLPKEEDRISNHDFTPYWKNIQ